VALASPGATAADAATAAAGSEDAYRLAVWPERLDSPRFALVDGDGTARTLADYRGRIVIVYFGFLRCPDACPTELLKLAQVVKRLGAPGDQVQVLFITLDPERDTPSELNAYVHAFDPRFVALTGTSGAIDAAANSFNVPYARVPLGNDYTISHTSATFIFDRSGRLRLIGASVTPIAYFVHDLERLLQ
jgi:protein SCO1/2